MDKIKNHPLRIFHGPVNICGIGRSIADWQRENKQAQSDFIVFSDKTTFQNSHQNLHLEKSGPLKNLFLKIQFFAHSSRRYDLFHFYFGKTLLPLNLDLPILRLMGKKIVMDYVGSDIRLYKLQTKINPYYKLRKAKSVWDHFDLAKRARMVWQGLWFHICFTGLALYPHARTSIPKKKINHTLWINKTLPVPAGPPQSKNNDRPVIIHAPTDIHTKGTEYVEKAVEDLRSEGLEFEFNLIQKLPHDELITILQSKADIVIDQLYSGGFGVFAMEAMAHGRPVCSFILPEIRSQIPDLPVVQCTIDTLKDNLRELIVNKEKRESIGRQSWDFAQSHFDRDRIYEDLWCLYLSL